MTYFGTAMDRSLGESGHQQTTHVRDDEYFIPSKCHQNQSGDSREGVEM